MEVRARGRTGKSNKTKVGRGARGTWVYILSTVHEGMQRGLNVELMT
jgi:hypothetical protein